MILAPVASQEPDRVRSSAPATYSTTSPFQLAVEPALCRRDAAQPPHGGELSSAQVGCSRHGSDSAAQVCVPCNAAELDIERNLALVACRSVRQVPSALH